MHATVSIEKKSFNTNQTLLTTAQKEAYSRNGFLVFDHFIENNICDLLIERAQKMIENFDPEEIKVIFSTKNSSQYKSPYFLDSGDKIRFFLEENAMNEKGELIKDKQFCINKMGHALHDLDPVFNCFSRSHKIATLVNDLGVLDPLLIQSMYICKQPHIGGEVGCHQDNTYIYIKEQPVTGLWFALEDATIENGCLWAIPGGHKTALKNRVIRDKNNHIRTEIYDDSPWPMDELIPLEVKRGSVIVLHGLLPHMSKENRSTKSRHAYTLHVVSGRYEYSADNWLKRPDYMPFRGFL